MILTMNDAGNRSMDPSTSALTADLPLEEDARVTSTSNSDAMKAAPEVLLGDAIATESVVPTSLVDFVADADAILDAAKSSILQSSPSKKSSKTISDDGSCFTVMTENEQTVAKTMTDVQETDPVSLQARVDWLESLGAAVTRLPSSLGIYRGEVVSDVGQRAKDDAPALLDESLDEAGVSNASAKGGGGRKEKLSRSFATRREDGSEADATSTEKISYSSPPSVQRTSSASSVAASGDDWNDDEPLKNQRNRTRHKCVGACTLLLTITVVASVISAIMSHGTKNNTPADAGSATGMDSLSPEYSNNNIGHGPGKRSPPTLSPSFAPTVDTKENAPTPPANPTSFPAQTPAMVTPTLPVKTYVPGDLVVEKGGIRLSRGLDVRIIARAGTPVKLADGTESSEPFHHRPDFGGTFPNPGGGWTYLSNSEVEDKRGGVGKISFNSRGEVIGYQMQLKGTTRNCGGGKTPWHTWITCEEPLRRHDRTGQIYEVDPLGDPVLKDPKPTILSVLGGKGRYESFAHDCRDRSKPRFFVTEDHFNGALRRFTPQKVDWENPSSMLYDKSGDMEYLVIKPSNNNETEGTYVWSTDKSAAELSARKYYRNSEGIDVVDNKLFFVSKRREDIYVLDLDGNTYTADSAKGGAFDGQTDQVVSVIGDDDESILYFTEDGGEDAGIHGRDSSGRLFTILESSLYKEETTGLAFSPDFMHMYAAYQSNGVLLDVTREDGYPFTGKELNIKYHSSMDDSISGVGSEAVVSSEDGK